MKRNLSIIAALLMVIAGRSSNKFSSNHSAEQREFDWYAVDSSGATATFLNRGKKPNTSASGRYYGFTTLNITSARDVTLFQ